MAPNGAIMACCCMNAAAIGLNPKPNMGGAAIGIIAAAEAATNGWAAMVRAFFLFFGTVEAFFLRIESDVEARFAGLAGFAAGFESPSTDYTPSALARSTSESTVGTTYAF